MAANCWLVPKAIAGLDGETVIETRFAGPTVTVAEPVMLPEMAVITAAPVETLVANPAEEIPAMAGFDEFQVAELVRS